MDARGVLAILVWLGAVPSSAQQSEPDVARFITTMKSELGKWHDETLATINLKEKDNIVLALNFLTYSQMEPKLSMFSDPGHDSGWLKIDKCKYVRIQYYYPEGGRGNVSASGHLTKIDLNKSNWKAATTSISRNWVDVALKSEVDDFIIKTSVEHQLEFVAGGKPSQFVRKPTQHAAYNRREITFSVEAPFERVVAAARLMNSECKGQDAPF